MNNNNVYVRSSKTIRTISLTRILFLLPIILYGYYKNGIVLYMQNHMLLYLVKPLTLLFGSIVISILINIFYEAIIKHNKKKIMDMIFSSFHVEYAIIMACLTTTNINLIIYFSVLTVILFISKFIKNRVNIMSIIFIVIYFISIYTSNFDYANTFEITNNVKLNLLDYILGNNIGGLFATNVLFIVIAYIGLTLTNNIKKSIPLYATISYILLSIIYYVITKNSVYEMIFLYNYIFIFTYVITDSVTSCYTKNGTRLYGLLIGISTFGLYFVNPILAPYISVLIISLFNNLIDRKLK